MTSTWWPWGRGGAIGTIGSTKRTVDVAFADESDGEIHTLEDVRGAVIE